MSISEPGWLNFEQVPAHRDPVAGERTLSVAVASDGVVFTVAHNGRPTACTISFDDFDFLVHFVEHGRANSSSS